MVRRGPTQSPSPGPVTPPHARWCARPQHRHRHQEDGVCCAHGDHPGPTGDSDPPGPGGCDIVLIQGRSLAQPRVLTTQQGLETFRVPPGKRWVTVRPTAPRTESGVAPESVAPGRSPLYTNLRLIPWVELGLLTSPVPTARL